MNKKLNLPFCLFMLLLITTSGCKAQKVAYDSSFHNSYYDQKTSQHKLLPKGTSDIVFLGNSITDIGEWAEIWQNLIVKNRGISSDITFGVLDRLEDITSGKPSKIFIMIGINDIARNIPVEVIAKNYKTILTRIRKESPQTKIYVQSILPTNSDFTDYINHQNKVEAILKSNTKLIAICKEMDITYINLWPHFANEDGKLKTEFTNDGLHLKGAGYMEWKRVLETAGLCCE